MVDNTIALQLKPVDFATPLMQAARLRQTDMQEQQFQQEAAQQKFGQAASDVLSAPASEQPKLWAQKADELRDAGLISPQVHSQWRDSYSPLAAQQLLARAMPAKDWLSQRRADEESKRAQGNADREFGANQSYRNSQLELARRAADRADEEKPVIKEVVNPVTGATEIYRIMPRAGESKRIDTGAQQPSATPGLNPKSPFGTALLKADAERVTEYTGGAKLAEEGIASLDQIDTLRKQAFTAPVIGPLAAKVGHPATQALDAATNALALDVAQKMKGSLSDKDIAFVKSQVPTAATGGGAGETASGAIRAGFERTKQRALFFRSWAELNGNINGADAAWSRYVNENPMTVEDKKAVGGRRYNPDFNKDFGKYLVRPGTIEDGWQFKGGDPADAKNWAKVQ